MVTKSDENIPRCYWMPHRPKQYLGSSSPSQGNPVGFRMTALRALRFNVRPSGERITSVGLKYGSKMHQRSRS